MFQISILQQCGFNLVELVCKFWVEADHQGMVNKCFYYFYKKSFLIHKFPYKCDICYIGCTTQRLELRIDQHIPSTIHTNNLDCSVVLSDQNSSSAIAQHQLDNPACAAAYNPKMFTILEFSSNKLHLSILKALLISEFQPVSCKQKKFYLLLLFNIKALNPNSPDLVHEENNIIHAYPSGLQ